MSLRTQEDNSSGIERQGSLRCIRDGRIFERRQLPSNQDRLAFAGVYLFTLLLHVRPNELVPGLVGSFPLIKIVAILTTLIYFASRLNENRKLMSYPLEMKMVGLIAVLAILFIPVATSPQDSLDVLSDTFLKIVLIFALMLNVIGTSERLRSLLKLVLICETAFAIDAIRSFHAGEVDVSNRIRGAFVGGIFGNANDLATSLIMYLPLAVAFALTNKGILRLIYIACAVLMGVAVLISFSRAGFIGFIVAGGVLLWKLGRGKRVTWVASAVLLGGLLILLMPSGYGARVFTIFRPEADPTGSAQQRQMVLQHGVLVAARHAVIGIGMGNFHIYSFRELRAHNSWVEITAELGVVGLLAYATLIIAPLRSLRRIELETLGAKQTQSETYYFSVALQAMLAAYIVGNSFTSIQYYWFLYYAVAYAVALRKIHGLEQMEPMPEIWSGSAGVLWFHGAKGSLSEPVLLRSGPSTNS